jgi:hypothetical protein
MIRVVKHGYRAEPKLLWASLAMTAWRRCLTLVGIWLALITDGLVHHHETQMYVMPADRRVRDADVGAVGDADRTTRRWATG